MKGCSCKKGCQSQRCSCRKNNYTCGPGCQCHDCTNLPVTETQLEVSSGESSESEPEEIQDTELVTIFVEDIYEHID